MIWPEGMKYRPIAHWPGTLKSKRSRSPFSASTQATISLLRKELGAVGARDAVLQIALNEGQFRIDGAPRAQAIPDHPGVILSFTTKDGAFSFPCDTFSDWISNLRAIALTLESLRAIDRHGVTQHAEQYDGWKAIEAPTSRGFSLASEAAACLYEAADMVVDPGYIYERDAMQRILRKAQFKSHPDQGGTAEAFDRVSQAEQFLKSVGVL